VGEIEGRVKTHLQKVAGEKGISLLECQPMVDHVHLLVEAGSDEELSWTMKLLKGRSSYELFRGLPELKLDASENSFWQRSFAARLVPGNQIERVRQYIRTQDERLEKYER
jgi:REP element-mobilizing transposase RayT